uniref:Uncharacterized protein n=1 Tax=mine drainage metagenome TaxID=410659 RepID=E6QWY9_9ZZZZ
MRNISPRKKPCVWCQAYVIRSPAPLLPVAAACVTLWAAKGNQVIFSNSTLFMVEQVCPACTAATPYNLSNNPNEVAFFVQSAKKFSDKRFDLQYSFY